MTDKTILNLTQHSATAEQTAAGVIDFPESLRAELHKLLTFDELPTKAELEERVNALIRLIFDARKDKAFKTDSIMIGGALFLMPALFNRLVQYGFLPCFAFSIRESKEQTNPDGSVTKVSVFKHKGFVTPSF